MSERKNQQVTVIQQLRFKTFPKDPALKNTFSLIPSPTSPKILTTTLAQRLLQPLIPDKNSSLKKSSGDGRL